MPIEFLMLTPTFCPGCKGELYEMDCTTFYCKLCDSQWQIESEIPDHYYDSLNGSVKE
jgi:hypothetical protein